MPTSDRITPAVLAAVVCLASCKNVISGPKELGVDCAKSTLTPGGSVSTNTGDVTCRNSLGEGGNFFSLVITQSSAVMLTVDAPKRLVAELYDTADHMIWISFRDDALPKLEAPFVLGPGTYVLRVTAYGGSDVRYTVSAPALSLDGCLSQVSLDPVFRVPLVNVTKGASISGTLTATSCRDASGTGSLPMLAFWLLSPAPTTFAVTATLDKPGKAVMVGIPQEFFGPGSWTKSLVSDQQVPDKSVIWNTALLRFFASSTSVLPVAYTIKVE